MILDPRYIEKAVGRLQCGNVQGTVFLIDSELAITAEHTLFDYHEDNSTEIILEFLNAAAEKISVKALPRHIDKNLDIAILDLEKPIEGIEYLNLVHSHIPYNEKWETYGYPHEKVSFGGKYSGVVLKAQIESSWIWDIELVCDQKSNETNFEGLSGAPLVINDCVRGILVKKLGNSLAAISIHKIKLFLDKNGIKYKDEFNRDELPEALKSEIESALPHHSMFSQIEYSITENRSGYILLNGSPGSGKTNISASFQPVSETIKICGRYFVNTPDDSAFVMAKSSEINFAEWLEETVVGILYNTVPQKREVPLAKRIEIVSQCLQALAAHYLEKKKIAVLIIDGLDEAAQLGDQKIENLLGILPKTLPENLVILLSCTSAEILPNAFRPLITNKREIKVIPLDQHLCEEFIHRELADTNIPQPYRQLLAEKSEGHPLYLRYLVKYVKNHHANLSLENFFQDIPIFGGDIEIYYERIWNSIRENDDEVWIVATIAALRNRVERESFKAMLPEKTQYAFISVFPKVQHLLADALLISIYHPSFGSFVQKKTSDILKDVHQHISKFCLREMKHEYSLKNRIFHLLNSSDELITLAIQHCNQEWIDECAMQSVEPDIILSDVREALRIAILHGNCPEVIRILLLLQRIAFRYNIVFVRYATAMAKALLAMKKPKEAMRYILRRSVLIVPNEDALYFLNKFYEENALEETKQLQDAVYKKYLFLFHNEVNNKTEDGHSSLSVETLFLRVKAITLSANLNFDNADYGITRCLKSFRRLLSYEPNNHDSDSNKAFLENVVAYSSGYFLWRFDKYRSIKDYRAGGHQITGMAIRLFAKMILYYKSFEGWCNGPQKSQAFGQLISDLELLLDETSVDHIEKNTLPIVLTALLESSSRYDIVEKLITKSINVPDRLEIREENGVDPNWGTIRDYFSCFQYLGYLDKEDNYPQLPQLHGATWEQFIIAYIEFIGFALGKTRKLRAVKNSQGLDDITSRVKNFLHREMKFTLEQRIAWERSYALPEEIFPFIYFHFTSFFIEFFPDELPWLLKLIEENSKDQLGLYTEGFREVVFVVLKEALKSSEHKANIFALLKVLENHIDAGVQNRLERTLDFLRLIELYGILGSEERIQIVYKKMLQTSMGPSWYKEDQLTLMNTALEALGVPDSSKKYLRKIAGRLDYASGEMTFQRYVRMEKENFMGLLCKIGHPHKAIEYFKNLVLPDAEQILQQAESSVIDAPTQGQGTIYGAKEIDEQNGILHIIKQINASSSFIKWAIAELFVPGDSRYVKDYASIMANILNELENRESSNVQILQRRLTRFIVTELDEEFQNDFLSELSKCLSERNNRGLLQNLSKVDISIKTNDETIIPQFEPSVKKQDTNSDSENSSDDYELFMPGTFGTQKSMRTLDQKLNQAQEELKIDSIAKAKQYAFEGLEAVQKGGWNIWAGNSDHDVKRAFKLLMDLSNSSNDCIRAIGELVLQESYAPIWMMVDTIVEMLGDKTEIAEKEYILNDILEHIRLIVRPSNESIEKFDWLENTNSQDTADLLLSKLLVWMLNHPVLVMKYRTAEVLNWLSTMESDTFIPLLIEESLAEKHNGSSETASGILHGVAMNHPLLVWKYIEENKKYCRQILALRHFMIKDTFIRITEIAVTAGNQEAIKIHEALNSSFAKKFDKVTSITQEKPFWAERVQHILIQLEELNLIGASFYEEFSQMVKECCQPLEIEEMMRVDSYIKRSFLIGNEMLDNFTAILRFAINIVITKGVDAENRERVASILRIYNPFFSDANLKLDQKHDVSEAIEGIFNEEHKDFQRCISRDDKYYLHFYERVYDEETEEMKRFEVIGFFADSVSFDGHTNLDAIYETFASNSYPLAANTSEQPIIVPLTKPAIIKLNPAMAIGGSFTPSVAHSDFFSIFHNVKNDDFERSTWRRGRMWTSNKIGFPVREGCSLIISKEKIRNQFSLWKLVWLVRSSEGSMIIDEQTKKAYFLQKLRNAHNEH